MYHIVKAILAPEPDLPPLFQIVFWTSYALFTLFGFIFDIILIAGAFGIGPGVSLSHYNGELVLARVILLQIVWLVTLIPWLKFRSVHIRQRKNRWRQTRHGNPPRESHTRASMERLIAIEMETLGDEEQGEVLVIEEDSRNALL
jgi:hypothetical protein